MKKLILVFAAIAISAGVYAQAGSTNKTTSPQNVDKTQSQNLHNQQDKTQNQHLQNQQDLNRIQNQNSQNNQQDKNVIYDQNDSGGMSYCSNGVVMINGKMMELNNGIMTPFQDNDMTMINGTKIKSDGAYSQKNGINLKLKEGYHMDMAGNVMVPLQIDYSKHGPKNSTDNSSTDKTNNGKSITQNVQKSSTDKSNSDGIMMENGKMMKVKNGQRTAFQDIDMTMSNGTKIMNDGTYINKDGSKMTMTEGQHIDMEGNMIPRNTNRDYNMDYNRHNQNNPADQSNSDGVFMEKGKMMKVKNGKRTALQDNTMTMSNGTKIMSDGTCISKDGTKTTIKEGQRMDMSGNMVHMNTNKDNNMYLIQDSTRNREN